MAREHFSTGRAPRAQADALRMRLQSISNQPHIHMYGPYTHTQARPLPNLSDASKRRREIREGARLIERCPATNTPRQSTRTSTTSQAGTNTNVERSTNTNVERAATNTNVSNAPGLVRGSVTNAKSEPSLT